MIPTNTTIRHPKAALFHLLKTEGSDLGWERSVLVGEAAQLIQGSTEDTLRWTEEGLEGMINDGIVKAIGINQHNLVALA
nr:hypothetical protein [uncultured Polynucleobacter sp.]